MTLRILLLSYYFPPDLASFRVEALVNALFTQVNGDVEIDVLTTQPHRYPSYSDVGDHALHWPKLTITRIKLPPQGFGIWGQAWGLPTMLMACVKRLKTNSTTWL